MNAINILLVEDNEGDIVLTLEALKESKMTISIEVVRDGSEALDYLYRRNGHTSSLIPHLVLLDLNLPGISGKEVLKIAKSDATLEKIPIVILTTSDAEIDILESYNLKADCFITKPVNVGKFIEMVKILEAFLAKAMQLPDPELQTK